MEKSLLSDLPEDITYRILSAADLQGGTILTNADAIRLSLVSKQLFDIVQKRPNLIFNPSPCDDVFEEEVNYIARTLDRYHTDNIPLESFTMRICRRGFYGMGIYDRCIELAAKKSPRKLDLYMFRPWDHPPHVLPQPVLEAESLVEFVARSCCLKLDRTVAWPNLKRLRLLSLSRKPVPGEEAFEYITRGCPSLENLEVDCEGFATSRFNVANLRNLKKLYMELRTDQRLEVNARTPPNLESIVCRRGRVDLGDAEYPNLTTLEMGHQGIGDRFFTNFARKFPVLEKLSLGVRIPLNSQRINLSSMSLKEIELKGIGVTSLEACFNLPNLVRFCYSQWNYHNKILPKFSFQGNSSGWSSEITLEEHKSNIGVPWFLELNKFLAALNGSETTIKVSFFGGEEVLFDEDHQTIANSVIPVQGIREFSMEDSDEAYWWGFSSSAASAILDCIFLICQPREIKFMGRYCKDREFPKLLYERLISSSLDHHGVTDFEMSYEIYRERSQSRTRFKD